MAAGIIDGKLIASVIRKKIAEDVAALRAGGTVPGLAVVLTGDDPASLSYVTAKGKACEEVGIYSRDIRLPSSVTQEELLSLVDDLNGDPAIHGILVQLPLPEQVDEQKIVFRIDPEKDVDGFHPVNLGKLMLDQDCFIPCTPNGIVRLLCESGVRLSGSHVVIVGRSNIVGKPVANMLIRKTAEGNATVTVCHTGTPDISVYTRQADILIAAAGRPELIRSGMVKEGATVIDVGVNRVSDPGRKRGFRLVGDVAFEEVRERAGLITPVPGGVGPMTIAMLLENTVKAATRSTGA